MATLNQYGESGSLDYVVDLCLRFFAGREIGPERLLARGFEESTGGLRAASEESALSDLAGFSEPGENKKNRSTNTTIC